MIEVIVVEVPRYAATALMNDSRYGLLCEEIAAAWLLFKPICYGRSFPFKAVSLKESDLI